MLLINKFKQLNQKRMKDKYYHNDYKKMMGLDETRTASEKLLDKALGGFKAKPEVIQKAVEKKIKEENVNLTHIDVFNKLAKNIQNNKNAVKILKPLNILRKCLNDQSFIRSPDINTIDQWKVIVNLILNSDDKLIGNYSEIGLVIECLVEIFSLILICINKLKGEGDTVKQEESEAKKQTNQKPQQKIKDNVLGELSQICKIHLLYLKLFTDDSFSFNKLLSELKAKFTSYYQALLKGDKSQLAKPKLYQYLQILLVKLFNLPFAKHEWIKQSLSQFFRFFNISYKHLLKQDILSQYLKIYNQFINTKTSKTQGESVNIFGTGGKGGKIESVQIVSNDALDKWTSKQ